MQKLQRSKTLAMTLERLQFADFRRRVRETLNETRSGPPVATAATDREILAALRERLDR